MNEAGYRLLKEYESFAKVMPGQPDVAHAYVDPISGGEPITIGWGFTGGFQLGDIMTRDEADLRLTAECQRLEVRIRGACTVTPTENEVAAMVVCAFNIGIEGFLGSSMIKAHNRSDKQAAARAFGLWNKSQKRVVAGLTRRRAAEAALYLKPVEGTSLPMPQAVDAPASLARSPIVHGSVLAGGASTLGVVAEAARSVRETRDSIGDLLPYVLVAAALIGAGYVVWWRLKQRKGGFA